MKHRTTAVLSTVLATLWLAPLALAGQSTPGNTAPDSHPRPACPGVCPTCMACGTMAPRPPWSDPLGTQGARS